MLNLSTTRAAQAFTQLLAVCKRVALACSCNGAGETRELYEAHVMTDDPRLVNSPSAEARRLYVNTLGPRAEPYARGAGVLVTPCPNCADIRAAVALAKAAGAR